MEAGVCLAFYVLNLCGLRSMNGIVVLLRSDYVFSPELYRSTNGGKSFEFKVSNWVSNPGRSSFTCYQSLTRVGYSEPLLTHKSKVIYFDMKTRQPTPLPDEIRKTIPIPKVPDLDYGKYQMVNIPEKHFVYDIHIQPSDIDELGHTNNTRYVRFCSDCALMASATGFFTEAADLLSVPIMEMSSLFAVESGVGDRLHVYTWQDDKSPELIYFIIRKGDQPIFSSQWKLALKRFSKL